MAPRTEPQVDEKQQVRTVKAALQERFAGQVPAAAVSRAVDRGVAQFRGAPVRTFVPLLVQKQVTEQLRHARPR